MHFEEESGGTERFGRECHRGNESSVAAGVSISRSGSLNTMCAVHDDGGNDVVHVGNISEVYHEIVIPEAIASFGEPYVVCPGVSSFFYGVSHVVCAEELCLFDVDRFPGLCGGDEQIGLPTQKGGYLDDVHHLGDFSCLPGFVDVGEQA